MDWLGMMMLNIYLIHIKIGLKHFISLGVVILLYHEDLQGKQ
jgi:hypothetical protein